jgi:uncharacterized protein (TIGR02391 family)
MEQIEPLEVTNPDAAWVRTEFEKLYAEWVAWQRDVEAIVDQPYDRRTQSEVFADGKENRLKHDVLQAKTLTFLNNNVKGHGFICGFDGRHIDRTDLRLKVRVEHRLHELEMLRGALPWSKTRVARPAPERPGGIWTLLHKRVTEVAKPRFESGHYADAVEAAFKELNAEVKNLYMETAQSELDGVPLMRKAFTPTAPVIRLDDISTDSGRSVQQGYMDLFAGSMAAIRNPKAHGNLIITADRAFHLLMLASLLFLKLEERM